MNLRGNAVTHPCLEPFLDFEATGDEGDYDIYNQDNLVYDEPDLSGGVEGVDYLITYGGQEEETEDY